MAERRRAIRLGSVTFVAHADDDGLRHIAGRLSSRGYDVERTAHFVVCRRPGRRETVLMHRFDEATVDEDLAPLVAGELGAVGMVTSAREYGDALFGIVASTCPSSLDCPTCGRLHIDLPAIWRHYCLNSLVRYRALLSEPPGAGPPEAHVAQFAAVYRRVLELRVGASLLDVGSSLGFLPVLVALRAPGATVVGCDSRPDAVACATDLAAAAGVGGVTFRVGDVLAPGFPGVGRYDTVTAVHLLEHLTDDELPVAMGNLLRTAARRLIVAVPYEAELQPLYGHRQTFTPEKLRAWGRWCADALAGGRYRCEDVTGGLLVVDRRP